VTLLNLTLSIYLIMSVVAIAAFAIDKQAAERGERRTPERTLHTIEALGGWPGALIALDLLKHKRQKMSYKITLYLISALHVAAWALVWALAV
jgi:uncharacterized membrane protein YsdA (DUF1294 family)